MNNDLIVDDLIPSEPVDPAILLSKETEQDGCIHVSLGPFRVEEEKNDTCDR